MTTLKHQTISGIKWTVAASIAQRVISFATTVILARILSPADFGLFALAFVMIDGFGIFKSLGFDSALVRRKDEDIARACNTAFFLIPAMGMILFALLFLFAPIGAKWLDNPQVTPVIRALAVIFVISTFGKVPQTVLYRDMKFRYKSIADVSATLIYTSSAVILALNKMGVWSLVVAYILKTLTQVSIEWYFSGWKPTLIRFEKPFSTQINADQTQVSADNPRLSALKNLFAYRIKFEFDRSIAWDMFHFGKYVLGSGIVWFLYSNLDNITIGKLLGVTMLGYYALSRNISNFLSDYFLGKMGMVMFPAYSKIQDDADDVKRVMLRTLKYISIIVFPFSLGLFLFAPDILRLVFGAKWLPATNVLRILAFVGIFNALGAPIWPIFLARGRSKADFQVGLAQVSIFFVLIVPLALKFQLVGVGIALLASTITSFIIGIFRIKGILHIKFSHILEPLKPALLSSLLMLATAALIHNFWVSAAGALLVYLGTNYAINRDMFREAREIFV